MFTRKFIKSNNNKPVGHLSAVMFAEQLLKSDRINDAIRKIKQHLSFKHDQFQALCKPLIDQVAQYCQQLPDSTSHYYAQNGGLLNYGFSRTVAALELLQSFLVLNDADEVSEEQTLWSYALFSAGLLQGLGKLYTDYKIELFDDKGKFLHIWNPLVDYSLKTDTYYDYEFINDYENDLRCRINLLLAKQLMPEVGMKWIASNSEVLASWLALLNEDYDAAGMLGALLRRANIVAQQLYLEEFLERNVQIQHPLSNKFVDGADSQFAATHDFMLGAKFLQWLTVALANGHIQLNKPPGCMLIREGLFVHMELFKQFIRENPQHKNWRAVLHAVNNWQLNKSHENLNVKKDSKGLMIDLSTIPESLMVFNAATKKSEVRSGLHITSLLSSSEPAKMQQLSSSGKWVEAAQLFMQPLGIRRGI